MTFRFRAAPLLELRRKQLEDVRGILARAQHELADAARTLADAEQAEQDAGANFRDALLQGVDGEIIQRHRNWITHQQRVVSRGREAREACQRTVDEATALVLDKRRQVRVLERLRERAWQRHVAEMRRREMKEIDLFATLQHARRVTEGGTDRDR